jgi:DNA/RNA-binding domain of Phe-tRNA-synthetase-like protein
MNLRISNDLKELLPTFSVIAYKIDFDEKFNAMQQSKLVDEYLSNIYKTYPTIYNYDEITKIPKLKLTRDGYKKVGKDPSHTRPACEALLRRVVKGNALYRLGDVIDLGNILSIETLRSVCVVDSDKLVGDIVIRLGKSSDNYEGINRGIINVTNIPVYTDEIGPFGCPTSDTLRTAVTATTKSILVMIICFDDFEKDIDEKRLVQLYQTNTLIKNITKIGDD